MGDRNDDLKCHICGRAFRLRISLKVHISTHKRDGILEGKSAEGPNISDRLIQEESPKLVKKLEGKSVEGSSRSDASVKILEKWYRPYKCQYCEKQFSLRSCLETHIVTCKAKSSHCSDAEWKKCPSLMNKSLSTDEKMSPSSDDPEDEIIDLSNDMNSQEEEENLSSGTESSGSEIELFVHVRKSHHKSKERNSLLTKNTDANLPPNLIETSFKQVKSKSNGQKKVRVKDTNRTLTEKNQDHTYSGLKIGKLKVTKGKQKVKKIKSKDDKPGTDYTGSVDPDVLSDANEQEVGETAKFFLCETCGKTFKKKGILKRHMKYHSSNVKCLTCEKVFISESALSKHVNSKTKCYGKIRTCKYCSQEFSEKSSLLQHIRNDHTDTEKRYIQCDICSKLTQRRRFQAHMRTHTGERPFQCELCGLSFFSLYYLQQHKLVQAKSAFQCKICSVSYLKKYNLYQHILKCHNEKDFKDFVTMQPRDEMKCSQCDLKFCTRNLLLKHKRTHANPLPDKSLKCSYCEKSYKSLGEKIMHERLHTGEKPYKCKFCYKRFRLFQVLKSHLRTHTNERPFLCKTCGKSFKQKPHLLAHQILHTGEKPYKCQFCGASFTNPNNRRAHERKNCKQTRTMETIEIITEETAPPNIVQVLAFQGHTSVQPTNQSPNVVTELEYIML